METVNVYSKVEDGKIKTNPNESPIWKQAFTEEEYMENPRKFPIWFKYTFKFDGLKVVMHTKTMKIVN